MAQYVHVLGLLGGYQEQFGGGVYGVLLEWSS